MSSASPLSRKTLDKWKRSPSPLQADDKQEDDMNNIFSRPSPPLLTQSLSMEDLTGKDQQPLDLEVPATSLYEIDQQYLKVPGGSESTFASPSGKLGGREPVAQDSWVTIFGFPSGSLSTVLSVFKTFGPMVKYEEGCGNWIDICYGNKWSAQKALSKNGTILAGTSFMVGVVPRKDPTAGSSFLTSPIKKRPVAESKSVGYGGEERGKNIFVTTPPQAQTQTDSFPIRLFKFIMGW
jgi:hypothetical protein